MRLRFIPSRGLGTDRWLLVALQRFYRELLFHWLWLREIEERHNEIIHASHVVWSKSSRSHVGLGEGNGAMQQLICGELSEGFSLLRVLLKERFRAIVNHVNVLAD